jgi:hypothetical protein
LLHTCTHARRWPRPLSLSRATHHASQRQRGATQYAS